MVSCTALKAHFPLIRERSEIMQEIQKIGYAFPGPRCACYGADMLLRQYKRVRGEKGTSFSYHDIRNVYLIVLYEQSPGEFKDFPDIYYHYGKQKFESGLELDMLQEYVMIPLDIFKKCMHNKTITTDLEAWLTFLSEDRPEKIIELITAYPAFKAMYETLYNMCLNTERVMEMFSEELRILDRNTVQYMMDEQQKQVDEQRKLIEEQSQQIDAQSQQIDAQSQQIDAQNQQIDAQNQQIDQQNQQLIAQRQQLAQQAAEIEDLKKKLAEVKN